MGGVKRKHSEEDDTVDGPRSRKGLEKGVANQTIVKENTGVGASAETGPDDGSGRKDDDAEEGDTGDHANDHWRDRLHRFDARSRKWERPETIYVSDGPGDPTIGTYPEERIQDLRNTYWSRPMTAFIASDSCYDEEGWRGSQPLGFGGQALVGLWVRNIQGKNDGTRRQYMVIKETREIQWSGNEELGEARILRGLADVGCNTIIRLRGYNRFPAQHKHRLYLEWAPHYNLEILIGRYRRWRRYFPEPWLWYLFFSMAKALFVLRYGVSPNKPLTYYDFTQAIKVHSLSTTTTPPKSSETVVQVISAPQTVDYDAMAFSDLQKECKRRSLPAAGRGKNKARLTQDLKDYDVRNRKETQRRDSVNPVLERDSEPGFMTPFQWNRIVHRDIKPENIFLGRGSTECPWYPTPKLGDFGHAMQGDRGGEEQSVTPEYDAPEGSSSTSDVYQLGLVMHKATTLRRAQFDGDRNLEFDGDDLPPYGPNLLNLIARCARQDYRNRPTPDVLYKIAMEGWKACKEHVKIEPDRFPLYYQKDTINQMQTGFYKPDKNDDLALQDLQFPDNTDGGTSRMSRLRPPQPHEFHPYQSLNLEFFEEPWNEFRNDADGSEEEITDSLDIEPDDYNRILLGSDYSSEYWSEIYKLKRTGDVRVDSEDEEGEGEGGEGGEGGEKVKEAEEES